MRACRRHCWFVEQQTGHTWCHLCGVHKDKAAEIADQYAISRAALLRRQADAVSQQTIQPQTINPDRPVSS